VTVALRALCVLAAVVCVGPAGGADAPQKQLNLLCTVPLPWCEALAKGFEEKSGVKVAVTQKGGPEALALLIAQKSSPRFDVWYAGTGDFHLQAGEQGLLDEYRPAQTAELRDWSDRQLQQTKNRSVGIYLRSIGLIVNTRRLAAKQLAEPKCWSDLIRPEYDDQLDLGHPAQSSAARATLLAFVQLYGEEKAFDMIKKIHANVGNYTRSATNAARAVARGDATLAVVFIYSGENEVTDGFPVKLIMPCEGLAYDVVSMSIVGKARNAENARAFYDWALTPESLEIGYAFSFWQMPAHKNAAVVSHVLNTDQVKLIDTELGRFGTTERRRLFGRWDREVSVLPRN
jgi:iron(III) transport system substrate-binding protein